MMEKVILDAINHMKTISKRKLSLDTKELIKFLQRILTLKLLDQNLKNDIWRPNQQKL